MDNTELLSKRLDALEKDYQDSMRFFDFYVNSVNMELQTIKKVLREKFNINMNFVSYTEKPQHCKELEQLSKELVGYEQ